MPRHCWSPITYRALPQLLQKLPRLRIGVREFRSLLARYPKEAAQLLNDTMCCDDTIPDEWRDAYAPYLGSTTFRDNLSKDEDDLSPEWLLRLVNYGAGVEEFNEPQVVRAFLSNKYARLDNITAASFVAQQVMERQLRLLDCSLSETSMRMTIVAGSRSWIPRTTPTSSVSCSAGTRRRGPSVMRRSDPPRACRAT